MWSAKALIGSTIVDKHDQPLGEVVDISIESSLGQSRNLIIALTKNTEQRTLMAPWGLLKSHRKKAQLPVSFDTAWRLAERSTNDNKTDKE